MAFPRLFSPIRIGSVELANRICLTGHGTGMGRDFKPDARQIAYYAERALGGVGLIMLGSQQVHPSSPGITNLLCNFDDSIIPGLRDIAAAVHNHGCRIFGYLSHMGFAASARPRALWSASAVYDQRYGEVAHAMTHDEMRELVLAYAAAAMRNLIAGMDGIEIHCGHGLLLAQFLSPRTNRRTDAYGGSLENRVRFPGEVLAAVRSQIGPRVPLGIRISGDELVEDGLDVAAVRAIVPLLVAAGNLDFVDVSAGNDGDLISNMLHEPPMGLPDAPFAAVAGAIRAAVNVPVIHGTRIHTPALAERVLAAGHADIVGMCRALIADPHLPDKARSGRASAIVPCVACEQACLGRLHRGQHISCVGNPRTGREVDWPAPVRTSTRRRIVIVGGGPAGMEAAATAAERGHEVALFERSAQLGGALRLAAMLPTRREWRRLIGHRMRRLRRAGVAIRLGTTADAIRLQRIGADAVVLATGASPARPMLPGADLPFVLLVEELLTGRPVVGRRIVLIDMLNRQSGLGVATLLARSGHEIRLMTEGPHAGWKLETQNLVHFHRLTLPYGVTIIPHLRVNSIGQNRIAVQDTYTRQEAELTDFDTVVIAAPGRAEIDLASALSEVGVTPHLIGDCYAPRDVEAAILEGHQLGREL
jgi:2,4-dienoyl-CoA reductase-like NADH-dependent reductase (Old Yellow Enzyme family)